MVGDRGSAECSWTLSLWGTGVVLSAVGHCHCGGQG